MPDHEALILQPIGDEIVIYDPDDQMGHCVQAADWEAALNSGLTRRQALAALVSTGLAYSVAIPAPAAAASMPHLCVGNCGVCNQMGLACCNAGPQKLCVRSCSPADCNNQVLVAAQCGEIVRTCVTA